MQEPSGSGAPQEKAQQHSAHQGDPQVSPADGKHQMQPAAQKDRQKQHVSKQGMPAAQGFQKPVPEAKPDTQKAADSKPEGCNFWNRHPKNRRQPLCRGSSYTRAEMVPSTATWPPSRDRVFS